ncbi:MAG: hypothetical protein WAP03_27895 [Methylorubrum rhodinum]|uniref:hypothetical protein n=1 Tax=Methylorubrum rhodinum TaxID=29428 RepID=UPI003BB16914
MTDAPLWHARAYQMARDGFSIKQIAHACSVSKTTVGRLLYPAYRRQQAAGRKRLRAERRATDPEIRAADAARTTAAIRRRRNRSREETPDGP